MKSISTLLLLLFCSNVHSIEPKGGDINNVIGLDIVHIGNGSFNIYAVNKYPVFMSANIIAKGGLINKNSLNFFKPFERKKVLSFNVGNDKSEINFTRLVTFGSLQTSNSYIYRIPFQDGVKTKITQSFGDNRKSTHYNLNDPSAEYAIDFQTDLGTPVVASRAGVVVDAKYDSSEGCPDISCMGKSNFVLIEHSDGTLAQYAHFMQSKPIVKVDQQIKAGQIIGFVGSTGYSNGPHLHFEVSKPVWTGTNFQNRLFPLELTDGDHVFRAKTGSIVAFSANGRLISGLNEK